MRAKSLIKLTSALLLLILNLSFVESTPKLEVISIFIFPLLSDHSIILTKLILQELSILMLMLLLISNSWNHCINNTCSTVVDQTCTQTATEVDLATLLFLPELGELFWKQYFKTT